MQVITHPNEQVLGDYQKWVGPQLSALRNNKAWTFPFLCKQPEYWRLGPECYGITVFGYWIIDNSGLTKGNKMRPISDFLCASNFWNVGQKRDPKRVFQSQPVEETEIRFGGGGASCLQFARQNKKIKWYRERAQKSAWSSLESSAKFACAAWTETPPLRKEKHPAKGSPGRHSREIPKVHARLRITDGFFICSLLVCI